MQHTNVTTTTATVLQRIARCLIVPAMTMALVAGLSGSAFASPLENCSLNQKHCSQQQQQGNSGQQQQQPQPQGGFHVGCQSVILLPDGTTKSVCPGDGQGTGQQQQQQQ